MRSQETIEDSVLGRTAENLARELPGRKRSRKKKLLVALEALRPASAELPPAGETRIVIRLANCVRRR